MLIKDHINLTMRNPLIGRNMDEYGVRFPDMSEVYDKEFRDKVKQISNEESLNVKEGVYTCLTGPTYETPSEIKRVRVLGGDLVGMSTVPEAIVARHGGMTTLGISLITNKAAGLGGEELDHAEVVDIANKAEKNLVTLVKGVINEW